MAPNSIFNRPDGDDAESNSSARGVEGAEGVRILGKDEAIAASERASRDSKREAERGSGDRPSGPPDDVKPSLSFPLDHDAEAQSIDRPKPMPVVNVGPPTGEHDLPHWTEPATGKVPKVVIGEEADAGDQSQAWSAYAGGGPRWRDEHRSRDEADPGVAAHLASATRQEGALDTDERMTQEEFLGLDDVEMPSAGAPTARPRGSASDPVRIGSDPRRRTASGRGGPTGPRERPGGDGAEPPRDIGLAVKVGVGIAVAAIVAFLLGRWGATIFAAAVLFVAAGEFFAATHRKGYRPITRLGLAAVVCLVLGASWRGEGAIPLALFLTMLVGVVWYLVGASRESPLRSMAVTFFGVIYIGVLGSYAGLIARIGATGPTDAGAQGVSILLLVAFGAVAYDVGGLFIGSRMGRTTFTSISPNKTLEGLIGGFAAAIVAVLVVGTVFGPFSLWQDLWLGVACGFAAPIGDLAESLLKRDLGVKDMGDLLPGHGGMLDRFDGLLFVLPFAYYMTRVLLPIG